METICPLACPTPPPCISHWPVWRTQHRLYPRHRRQATRALFSALATEASLPLAIRLAAAEQAEKFGLLPTQVLRGLYEAYASTPDPASNTASGESDPTAPAPTRAVMLQEAQRQGTDAGRAQALAALYTQAHEHGVGASVARVSAPLLRNLTPSYALSWFAPWAVRALLSVGDVDTALSWYDFIEENESAEDAANREEVWLWLQIADAENRLVWDGDVVSKWLARQDTRKDKAALILSLLEGLGKPVTGDHWAMVWETAEAQDGIPRHTFVAGPCQRSAPRRFRLSGAH